MIWHLDLDSFYVSAERLRHPSLRGIPVAVGGLGVRGVLSTCSYEARKFGVRSAMPTAKALKLCPQLIVRHPDHEYYAELSRAIFALLPSYTPTFEIVSVDEAYLDMRGSESIYGPPPVAAAGLRRHIHSTTGLTASIGIATNRLVAKVATDFGKPDNFHVVAPGCEAAFFAPLPIARLPGCGPVTQKWLTERGVKTLGDLQGYPRDVLENRLGKFGTYLHDASFGRGSTEFHVESKNRSISRETTFEDDVADRKLLESILWGMCDELGAELRAEDVAARAVRLKLRYPPFETVTRVRTFSKASQSTNEIFDMAVTLLEENWDTHSPLRLVGVGCIIGIRENQLDLFKHATTTPQTEEIDRLKDAVRARFGEKSIRTGRDKT